LNTFIVLVMQKLKCNAIILLGKMAGQRLSDRDFQTFVKGSFRDVRRMFEISQGQA
jgi:hypothetical protein